MKRENVSTDLLVLSDGNPRLVPSLGEDEAMRNMVHDQKSKLYELAADIVKYGLSPLDSIAVYPSESYEGFYEVGEGNRRMCAIKLLIEPTRIQHLDERLFSKFNALSKSYHAPEAIEVCVFDNEEEFEHWMEIRHMGEQNGKGLSKWNSEQKARFNRKQKGTDRLLDFWDWLIEKGILTATEIRAITKTNWERILRDKYYPFLKLQSNEGFSVLEKDIDIFIERIKAVQRNLAGQTVAIVYGNEQIDAFYDKISNELYDMTYQEVIDSEREQIQLPLEIETGPSEQAQREMPVVDDSTGREEFFENQDELDRVEEVPPIDANTNGSMPRDLFNGCKTVIPYNYPIRTSNMRLNKIINELKRLSAEEFPNACGTLLRTLFELSSKVYLERQDGNDHTEDEFRHVLKSAANGLRNQGRISNSQHSAISKDVDNLRKIFNGYMHDTDGYPSSETLKNFFKAHKCFIEECLK